jgi:hypothetical protein
MRRYLARPCDSYNALFLVSIYWLWKIGDIVTLLKNGHDLMKLVGLWLLGTAIWIGVVTAYYWVSWHCGWGIQIWCPETLGGDYGLDARALIEHIAEISVGAPLIAAIVFGGGVLIHRRLGKQA